MRDSAARVAVVGGGIAGLATAFNVERGARDAGINLHVTVFESSSSVGGKLRTIREGGYLIEEGPNGWLDNEPATARLLSRVGLEEATLKSEDATRHRFLLVNGRLRELPMTPKAFIKSDLLSPASKLRVAAELFVPKRKDLGCAADNPERDETVYEFGRRRLGRAFAELLLDPMVKGIFGGDARRLSLAAAFPRMVELEKNYGGLFKAMIKIARERKRNGGAGGSPAGPGGTLTTVSGGMEMLPGTLSGLLRAEVLTDSPVAEVRPEGGRWAVTAAGRRHGPYDCVIDAAPAHAAAGHLSDERLSRLLEEIRYVPIAVVALAFDGKRVEHPLHGFGMLNPSNQGARLMGVLWSSSIFKDRAPEGKILLRCMAGGAANPEAAGLKDERLIGLCMDELGRLYGISGDPERAWVIRHEKAIAQYERGHLARIKEILGRVRATPGLFLTGSSYRGVSTNHCIAEAEKTAGAVLDYMASQGKVQAGPRELLPATKA